MIIISTTKSFRKRLWNVGDVFICLVITNLYQADVIRCRFEFEIFLVDLASPLKPNNLIHTVYRKAFLVKHGVSKHLDKLGLNEGVESAKLALVGLNNTIGGFKFRSKSGLLFQTEVRYQYPL